MTGARFIDLFRWDVRQVGRTPLLWAILLTLVASMAWGAFGTAKLHRAQIAAQAGAQAAETRHKANLQARMRAYRAPVTADSPAIPYWQDPTNISGFSQYFVLQQASKPHLPLSPLAVGVSDVAPSRLEIKLNTLFGFDDSYDFENPRGLALGQFGLAFVLVYLLPIALILLFALLVTFERDRGMLRLVAAQAASPRAWLGARVAAILVWSVPTIIAGLTVSLIVAGASPGAALPELLAALAIVTAYMLFWTGVALVILSRFAGAAATLGVLAAIWALLTIGLPMIGAALASAVAPAPSSIAYVDAQRRTNDAIQQGRDGILAKRFAERSDLRSSTDRISGLDHATRLSFLVPETERRLQPLRAAFEAHRTIQHNIASLLGLAMPSLGVESALARLAGTDDERHRRFEGQARDYQLGLRRIFYPLVQREIATPTPLAEPAARGRLNFDAHDILPPFTMAEEPASARLGGVLPFALWLVILAAMLACCGFGRIRGWPQDL